LAVRAPVDWEPLIDFVPVHARWAAQEPALMLLQVIVAALPEVTVLGFTFSDITGDAGVTVTVVDWVADPPGPLQVSS
jgi:hypothetical protein